MGAEVKQQPMGAQLKERLTVVLSLKERSKKTQMKDVQRL